MSPEAGPAPGKMRKNPRRKGRGFQPHPKPRVRAQFKPRIRAPLQRCRMDIKSARLQPLRDASARPKRTSRRSSREAAKECSPRRKAWVTIKRMASLGGAKESLLRSDAPNPNVFHRFISPTVTNNLYRHNGKHKLASCARIFEPDSNEVISSAQALSPYVAIFCV
jgi:hypothetical protein